MRIRIYFTSTKTFAQRIHMQEQWTINSLHMDLINSLKLQ